MRARGAPSFSTLASVRLTSARHPASSSSSLMPCTLSLVASSSSSSPSSSTRASRMSLLPLLLCLCAVLVSICVPCASAGSALYFDSPLAVADGIDLLPGSPGFGKCPRACSLQSAAPPIRPLHRRPSHRTAPHLLHSFLCCLLPISLMDRSVLHPPVPPSPRPPLLGAVRYSAV